ncbi:MAG: hypothetical protein IPM53_10205 [Anaerolineaceae bacterium]|nr:hypothetical protein [Anaerolineaceae bacterium]
MNTTQATLTMVLLFALRCLAPLALMFTIGYAMNWLVDKWEAEAEKEKVVAVAGGTAVPAANAISCWSIVGCSPEERENCPGFQQQQLPCWLARTRAEGDLPEKCITCQVYEGRPALA